LLVTVIERLFEAPTAELDHAMRPPYIAANGGSAIASNAIAPPPLEYAATDILDKFEYEDDTVFTIVDRVTASPVGERMRVARLSAKLTVPLLGDMVTH
jgi:hypothetical protein